MADAASLWNRPYRKQEQCVPLAQGLSADPPVRYPDGDEVGRGYAVPRKPNWDPHTTAHSGCADRPGTVRLDLSETLALDDGTLLYFHKGGQGYEPPSVPYGHVSADVLRSPPNSVFSRTELDRHGAEPRGRDGYGAGRANSTTVATYRVNPQPVGPQDANHAWLYKDPGHYPGVSLSGARYRKYGDAGPVQGRGDQRFAYLCWSWMRQDDPSGDPRFEVSGGGAVRALLKPGQLVYRCDVESIHTPAWDHLGHAAGEVVAIYVRVPVGGVDLYGWMVHSHIAGDQRTFHVDRA